MCLAKLQALVAVLIVGLAQSFAGFSDDVREGARFYPLLDEGGMGGVGVGSTMLGATGSEEVYTINEPVPRNQSDIKRRICRVMTRGIKVYGIFYGDFVKGTSTIISNFINNLGSSDIWNVVQSYRGVNGRIKDQIEWAGEHHDNYTQGKILTSDNGSIDKIIANALRVNKWVPSYNGIYVVFVANDVSEEFFGIRLCFEYCGYHALSRALGVKKAVIGDATQCPGTLPAPNRTTGISGCLQRYFRNQTDNAYSYSVNRNQGADSMIDILFQEVAETAANFDFWRWRSGTNVGDRCSAYYLNVQGVTLISGNGTNGGQVYQSPFNNAYNVDFGPGGKYLIQSMWSADKQACVLSE